jgi:hypothetical protein
VVDVTPYIIVDNQRISPVGWSPRTGSASTEQKGSEDQTFGVVDRVTISSEAREKSKWYEAQVISDSPTPKDLTYHFRHH